MDINDNYLSAYNKFAHTGRFNCYRNIKYYSGNYRYCVIKPVVV